MSAWDLAAALNVNHAVNNQVTFIQNQIANQSAVGTVIGQAEENILDTDSLAALLLTSINGEYGIPEQSVTVQYLTSAQMLVIPAAMAMDPAGVAPVQISNNATLIDRYNKIAGMSLADLRTAHANANTATAFRTAIDALDAAPFVEKNWDAEATYVPGGAEPLNPRARNVFYAMISAALQLNCDIRDVGALLRPNMRMEDHAYSLNYPLSRTNNKVFPYTLQCIAALNYPAVHNNALASWVRAIGIGSGILPTTSSISVVEYRYSLARPEAANRNNIMQIERTVGEKMHGLCMNIISMFGIMHLNKDHTFRTNDNNMQRIGTAYINTLKTVTSEEVVRDMIMSMEAIVRTGPHPFGLGQSYAVAQILANGDRLAQALRLRRQTPPPPVARFFICRGAANEWGALPVGAILNELYADELAAVEQVCALVEANPPAYSALHALYGVPGQLSPPPAAEAALAKMMPLVAGYSESQHGGEGSSRRGLALAQSLANVRRSNEGLCNAYKTLWDNYMEKMESTGLVDFARMAIAQPVVAEQ